MAWFKVDDSFTDHPKVKAIPRSARRAAVGLWTLAGSYAARQLTNGFIFKDDVIDLGCTPKDAKALVECGLWHEHGHDCDRCEPVSRDQYLFHDWLIYQRSRTFVLAERAKAAERQKRARDKAASQGESRRDKPVTDDVTSSEVHGAVTAPPTRPDPTRPVGGSSDGQRNVTHRSVPATRPTCSRHPNGDGGTACGGCRAVRQWDERAEADEEVERQRRADHQKTAAILAELEEARRLSVPRPDSTRGAAS